MSITHDHFHQYYNNHLYTIQLKDQENIPLIFLQEHFFEFYTLKTSNVFLSISKLNEKDLLSPSLLKG